MEQTWKRRSWRRFLLPLAALVVGFGLGVGVGVWVAPGAGEALLRETAVSGPASVLPDTVMQREYRFSRCAHSVSTAIDTSAFIGYTTEELERFDSPDEVRFPAGGAVTIVHSVDGCCPMHYLLRLDEASRLCVYHTDAALFTTELIQQLAFDSQGECSADDAANLAHGVVFDTLAEIDAYLESMES